MAIQYGIDVAITSWFRLKFSSVFSMTALETFSRPAQALN